MTTKDYVKFAEAIKEEMQKIDSADDQDMEYEFNAGQRAGIEKMARRIAEICQQDNANFRMGQFLNHAGIE